MTANPPLYTRYGFSRTGDPKAPLQITPYHEVCVHGLLRAAVLASAVDLVGGFVTRDAAGTDAVFTSDLSLRIPRSIPVTQLVAHAEALRVGRRLVTTGVRILSDAGVYALGETTFVRIPRETGEEVRIEDLATPPELPSHPLTRPLDEEVGIEIVDASRGIASLALRDRLRNPEGVMQGAVVAMLVEGAARAVAEHEVGHAQVVTELDLRYLSAAAVGPIDSKTVWLDPDERQRRRMLRVELRDRGRQDRLTTSAFVRVGDPPSVTRSPV